MSEKDMKTCITSDVHIIPEEYREVMDSISHLKLSTSFEEHYSQKTEEEVAKELEQLLKK